MKKYLPYILLVVCAVVITKIIDYATDTTDELTKEKEALEESVNEWISKWKESENNRIELRKKNLVQEHLIEAYENENDSLIDIMHNGTREQRDSIGTALIGRLQKRQHSKAPIERGL